MHITDNKYVIEKFESKIRDGNGQGPFQLIWSGSRGRALVGVERGQRPLSEHEFCTF